MIVAHKHKGQAVIYIALSFLFGVASVLMGIYLSEAGPLFLIPAFIIPIFIFIIYGDIKTPDPVFQIEENGDVVVSGEVVSNISKVSDASYKLARNKYQTFEYGDIELKTADGELTFKLVEDCEQVTKDILKLIYKNS